MPGVGIQAEVCGQSGGIRTGNGKHSAKWMLHTLLIKQLMCAIWTQIQVYVHVQLTSEVVRNTKHMLMATADPKAWNNKHLAKWNCLKHRTISICWCLLLASKLKFAASLVASELETASTLPSECYIHSSSNNKCARIFNEPVKRIYKNLAKKHVSEIWPPHKSERP